MEKFTRWLNRIYEVGMDQTQAYVAPSVDQTQAYVPPSQVGRSTQTFSGDKTTRAGGNRFSSSPDPGIVQQIQSLETIHQDLRNIFTNIRDRTNAFQNDHIRQSFEKAMIDGIDNIGRSHAMLVPAGN